MWQPGVHVYRMYTLYGNKNVNIKREMPFANLAKNRSVFYFVRLDLHGCGIIAFFHNFNK